MVCTYGQLVVTPYSYLQHTHPNPQTPRYHAYFTPELECETWRYAFRVDPAAGVGGGALLEAGPLSLAQSSPGYELPTVRVRIVSLATPLGTKVD